jgi:uncharacterized protein YjgD (DUF1641 family)
MKLMQSAIKVVEPVRLADLDTSFLALAKQMRDPEVRRGLAIALRFLHGLGSAVPSS